MKKILLRLTIIIFLIFGTLVSVPLILSVLSRGNIAADIHKIEKAASPYLYKYHSSTFELLAGEKENKPRITLIQGKRNLDINVKPAAQKPAPKPTQKKPTPTTQPQNDTETEPPADVTEPTEETSPDPVEELQTGETSFLPIGTVHASDSVNVINPNTNPAIEYINGAASSDFLITPNQEKIALTFEIESAPKQLPSLNINPEKLVPRQTGEEIIIYTRTNRKAFSLKNAAITDKKGSKTQVRMVLDSTSYDNFNITFNINNDWLSDKTRVFPLVLSVDTVSLFHERLISAVPVKQDFSATEKPKFIIDMSDVEEPLRTALLNRDYSKLKFGAIDARGKGRQIPAELVSSNGRLVLKFKNTGSYIRPGLFDLLVQYGDDPSFIGEEEFSWGVLAMNPNRAVYRPGQEAKIDITVLNELGRVVCDADLNLKITDPAGNITTLTTNNGIEITEGCFKKETELPDYTTTYKTSIAGTYNMRLTATTENGPYTITDKFTADSNSPFYVKRSGPTRIFPPKTYSMRMTIEANQNAASIVETVPNDFTITNSDEFDISRDGKQRITWEKKLEKGEEVEISYNFKGPSIYPALYFIGPLKIGSWQEPRVWQIAVDALNTLYPNGESTAGNNQWTYVGGSANYTNLQTNDGDTTYASSGTINNTEHTVHLDATSGSGTINHVTVYLVIKYPTGSGSEDLGHYVVIGGLPYEGMCSEFNSTSSYVSYSCQMTTSPATSSAWSWGEIDGMEAGVEADVMSYTQNITQVYVEVDYTEVSGPTNAQLMRHGKWFDGTATPEQPMTF
jgi:hypothetical protein